MQLFLALPYFTGHSSKDGQVTTVYDSQDYKIWFPRNDTYYEGDVAILKHISMLGSTCKMLQRVARWFHAKMPDNWGSPQNLLKALTLCISSDIDVWLYITSGIDEKQNNEMPERFLEIPPIANAILPLFSLVSFLRVQELRRDLATPFASTFFAVNNELAKIRAVLIES